MRGGHWRIRIWLALAYAVDAQDSVRAAGAEHFSGHHREFFSRFAAQVHLGIPEARRQIPPSRKTEVFDSGNPIEPPPADAFDKAPAESSWGFPASGGKVLLVYGGSQGSKAMNDVVAAWIDQGLPPDLSSSGRPGGELRELARYGSDTVKVRAYIAPISEAYRAADFALSRAGAMATAELCAWGIPAIVVPLPTAAADHQTAERQGARRRGRGGDDSAVRPHPLTLVQRSGVSALGSGKARRHEGEGARSARGRPPRPTLRGISFSSSQARSATLMQAASCSASFRSMTLNRSNRSAPGSLRRHRRRRNARARRAAGAARRRGHRLRRQSGSRRPISKRWGSKSSRGHDPDHVDGARELIVTSAMPSNHPELVRARELGIPITRRAEALGQAVAGGQLVGIAGTHGKTTTTVMTTAALDQPPVSSRPGSRGAASPSGTETFATHPTSCSSSKPTNTTAPS